MLGGCVIIAMLIGIALRLSMFIVPKSMWGDEYYSVWYTQNLEKMWTLNHPPAYYWLLSYFHGETAMRLFSIACGVGTVITTYYLTKHLFSRSVGSVAALLVAISPYFLQSSFEIRAYSLLGFLSTLCILMFVQKRWWAWAILAAVLPWVEHVGVFVALSLIIMFFFHKEINHWLSVATLSLGLWAGLVFHQIRNDENPLDPSKLIYWQEPMLMVKKVCGAFIQSHVGYRYSMLTLDQLPITSLWFWVLALASITAFAFAVRGFRACANPVKWLIFAPLLLLAYPTKFHARYLVEVMPLYYCLIAGGLCRR